MGFFVYKGVTFSDQPIGGGAATTLTIGTVTEGSAGADITGTPPDQVLNLTMPPPFRYIGSTAPDASGWNVSDIWLDTSTETS